jgi:hypothetical protein
MVLVIMSDKGIIDGVRQIDIGIMFDVRMISVIADKGVQQDTDVLCFDKDTCMAEIAHPYFVSLIPIVYRMGFSGEKRLEKPRLFRPDIEQFFYVVHRLRDSFHFCQMIDARMAERDV